MQNRRFCRALRAFHTSVLSERERERSESLEQLVYAGGILRDGKGERESALL